MNADRTKRFLICVHLCSSVAKNPSSGVPHHPALRCPPHAIERRRARAMPRQDASFACRPESNPRAKQTASQKGHIPARPRNRQTLGPSAAWRRFRRPHSLDVTHEFLGGGGNIERLCLTHRLLPLLVGSLNFGSITQPLGSIPFRGFHRYYGLFRPWAPLPYSRPRGSSTCGFSVRIGVPGSHVPLNRL